MTTDNQDNIDFNKLPDRLNLGCGFDKKTGYVNVDFSVMHHPDIVADVLKLGFLPKNHYSEIIAQDILEHLPRTSTTRALLHWASLLKKDGILTIRVPDILGVAQMLSDPKNQSIERQEVIIQNLFGTQAYTGDFHYTSFTEVTIRHYLEQCGFSIVEFKKLDGWLFEISAAKKRDVNPRDIDDFSDLLSGELNHRDFIGSCYKEILGRNVDDEGLNFYLGEMNAGRISREQLISMLVKSEERQQKRSVFTKYLQMASKKLGGK